MALNFYENLSSDFIKLLENGDEHNVIIEVGESSIMQPFKVHSTVLCYDVTIYHNGVIINDRLLIIAGFKNFTQSSELFYLDLLNSFDTSNVLWNLIHNGDLPIYTYGSTAIASLDNSTIFLIGGYIKNKTTNEFDYSKQVYTYDYNTSKWTTPSITGDSIPERQQMTGVINTSGTIYIFGGFNITNAITQAGKTYNDMNILDTFSFTWKSLSITNNIPLPGSDYSTCILPNGIIVYIGGQEEISYDKPSYLLGMKKIKLFDTKKDEWSSMEATGDDVDPRWIFSSVLTPDGRIIIFGGCTYDFTGVSPNLAVLDTTKNPYEWSIPSNSKVNLPPSIYGHTANLYYNYMIVTFGFNIDNKTYNSQVYLFDIRNNTWVTRFDPSTPISSPTSTSSPTPSRKPLLIGLGIGIGVVVLICIGIFIFYKRDRILRIDSTVSDRIHNDRIAGTGGD
ncbi:hypothetical protein Glove_13g197 [Diversispora epigaea]|uniref:Galactose oxidase n=1 Tax=Diversispora epigaea TaxID=1348612 RepID=A0A397JWD4_9GLOM|nr:hypothetical protein Glove_13g197 [Diversispora epigaea]